MQDLLRVEKLFASIDERDILQDVSFSIKAGELCALLGPSGCGKTTLLRALAGFQNIHSGNIYLNDKSISHLHPATRHIGFVFQDYALFPHMTIEQNIAFGIDKTPNKAQRVQELLELIELPDLGKRYPHELSGGQQQRVALARALAPKPKLLLMDEPFSNLDTELRQSLSMSIRNILKEAGLAAMLVTHDQTEAFAFGDEIGVLRAGKLEQWGKPYTLYHEPDNRFVAEFIGQGQMITAEVISDTVLQTSFGAISQQKEHTQIGKRLQLLSRPDDWAISDEGQSVVIQHKQFIGTQTLYQVASKQGEKIRIAAPSHQNYDVGDNVTICPQFEHIITFSEH